MSRLQGDAPTLVFVKFLYGWMVRNRVFCLISLVQGTGKNKKNGNIFERWK